MDAQNERTRVKMNGSSEKNLMELFESSIRNPLDDKTGQPYFDEFSKCTKDKLSKINVLHITNFHMFIKAQGFKDQLSCIFSWTRATIWWFISAGVIQRMCSSRGDC